MIKFNGVPINVTIFPDKTSQVWKIENLSEIGKTALVEWDFENEGELLHLAQLKDLLDSLNKETHLSIRYLPYGRQDKEVSNETTFALRSFSHILNALKFEEVIIVDPHSKIALELIECSHAIYPTKEVNQTREFLNSDVLCFPDMGAAEKYSSMYSGARVYGSKHRDQSTGNLSYNGVIGNVENKNVLIIDDICDGGGTFILLAKELYNKGAKEVNLFVSHGLFTKGLAPLKEAGIKRIFTPKGEQL